MSVNTEMLAMPAPVGIEKAENAMDVDPTGPENNSEDDAKSDVSDGEDFIVRDFLGKEGTKCTLNRQNDLESALDNDFNFKGNFFYAETQADAPNPCLSIDGIGVIGLPLNEREAKAIIACSAQAPFGKGSETIIDTKVRNTWEIEPSKVTFKSAKWTPWLERTVFSKIWNSLGVAPCTSQPRCELYKLLLYETGSQ